jgi:hypothetical protein
MECLYWEEIAETTSVRPISNKFSNESQTPEVSSRRGAQECQPNSPPKQANPFE